MQDLTDEELVQKVLKRDFEALGELFKRYEKSFYNLAYRFTGDHLAAEDIASEIFLRIYRYLPSFKVGPSSAEASGDTRKFMPWAMKVAANTCLTFIKQSAKNKVQSADLVRINEEGEEFRLEIEDKKINLQEDLEKKEIEVKVHQEMLELPKNYRLALYFYFWEDLSYDEIAKILEVPLNTVRTNIRRGKQRLKKTLKDII